ncbi:MULTISPECIES: aspartate/glutamate racemase family protein [Clostridium]|uniref:aspartate/glutamate racemase family protein n=1 Tax=Clostridium TaxID=1485 RepID=UPI000AA45BFE|nr:MULTISPECIES: amino acid racemase [Clostridium]
MKKTIGILAGMGPRSTAPFIDLVVDECQKQYGAKNDNDFPKMMIYSLPTPFYVDRPINHKAMKETIIEGLQKLEKAGVDFIAMPCNFAHIYFEELQKSINIPLLNIVEETVKKLPKSSRKITLFATNSTYEFGIYQNGIKKYGHEFAFKNKWQVTLNNLIKNIKINKDDEKNVETLKALINEVKEEDIENIIIGCTDINPVLKKLSPEINIIDSSKCLAEAVIKKYLK